MRNCACRGDNAGFVHLECLTELAKSKYSCGDVESALNAFHKCGNCKQDFKGALQLEMFRRFWRYHRSGTLRCVRDRDFRYNSIRSLAISVMDNGEVDAANQLLDQASNCSGNGQDLLLELKILRVRMLIKNDQHLVAVKLLQPMLPEAKACTASPDLYGQVMYLMTEAFFALDRFQEAYEMATELVPYYKGHYGLEHCMTLPGMSMYASACAKLGRVEEAKAKFEEVLTIETRVLGRDHPITQDTLGEMRTYGFAEPSG